ncbi:GNAT family N-acetyltransferase [Oceanobacillus piezotolerans]|uniref:GNAT family N-acetyltransferase n=1 Tax=Oceanobacillus piezotolerans TaxID=2448030 RepID=A0A498DHG6_9BACI|nr:GNAT family N-acetyltransferase [Oceanobacillus piezotolerans]RLL40119.1 GNAT family N-acetyltransferase [Oceanobacillus piezotolerans]
MKIRLVKSSDYYQISPLLNEWWGGRNMVDMLPKLFFDHFNDSSFVAEKDGEILGFLIGFLSQTYPNEAYIHFVGVNPVARKQSIGKQLYNQFFDVAKKNDRQIIRCVTSPINKTSIAFHTRMGFDIEKGDKVMDGISITSDYDGIGQDRVLFVKRLS